MVRRVLRSMFAAGLFDTPSDKGPIDFDAHASEVRKVAEEAIVVLRNERATLPIARGTKRIAVIGGYAEFGVISGGGSSLVNPVGGPALRVPLGGEGRFAFWREINVTPSSPLRAMRALVSEGSEVVFNDGRYPSEAARLAATADVAIVFGLQWMTENFDAPDLTLPQRSRRPDPRRRGRESAHGRRARDRRSRADAVAGQHRRGGRRVVSGPARRRRDRERAVRRGGARRPATDHVPRGGVAAAAPRDSGIRTARASARHGRVSRRRRCRLPRFRASESEAPVRVRLRAELHDLLVRRPRGRAVRPT